MLSVKFYGKPEVEFERTGVSDFSIRAIEKNGEEILVIPLGVNEAYAIKGWLEGFIEKAESQY